MSLTADLISQFVDATKDEKKESSDGIVYGVVQIVKDSDDKEHVYVQLDGSTEITPVSTTTNVNDGDRVTVLIKNHTATITGNYDSPSASTGQVDAVAGQITVLENAVAKKVTTETLTAQSAFLKFLYSDKATIEEIIAAEAKINAIEANEITVEDLKAIYIDTDSLEADFAKLGVTVIDKATIKELNATAGYFRNLKADFGEFEELTTDKLEANDAAIETIAAHIIDSDTGNFKFATIDFANIGEAALQSFFAKAGMLENVIIGDATVSGALVAVTFKGDLIEAETLKVDRLILRNDEDGLYYALNVDLLGQAVVKELPPAEQENLQNGLHGSAIVAHSVTADKIAVKDLAAFNALIAGFSIKPDQYKVDENGDVIYDADGYPEIEKHGAIYSGTKSSMDNTTPGIYLDNEGQVAFGDTNKFVKFYLNEETGEYELAIATNKIVIGSQSVGKELEDNRTLIESIRKSLSTLVVDKNGGTLLDQTDDGFTFNFADLKSDVDILNDNPLNALENRGRIQFDKNNGQPSITISPADTGIKLKLATDNIQFVKDDTPIATIAADDEGRMGMEVDNETVTGELRQSHSKVAGEFIWNVRSNGNYGLWWKG